MKSKISKEELALLTVFVGGYTLTRKPAYLSAIYRHKERLGEALIWSKQYLDMLNSTGKENGLKQYAENLLKSWKRLMELTKDQEREGVLQEKMKALQEMDPCKTPYSVGERLKSVS